MHRWRDHLLFWLSHDTSGIAIAVGVGVLGVFLARWLHGTTAYGVYVVTVLLAVVP